MTPFYLPNFSWVLDPVPFQDNDGIWCRALVKIPDDSRCCIQGTNPHKDIEKCFQIMLCCIGDFRVPQGCIQQFNWHKWNCALWCAFQTLLCIFATDLQFGLYCWLCVSSLTTWHNQSQGSCPFDAEIVKTWHRHQWARQMMQMSDLKCWQISHWMEGEEQEWYYWDLGLDVGVGFLLKWADDVLK